MLSINFKRKILFSLFSLTLLSYPQFSFSKEKVTKEEKRIKFELELDAYYTSIGLYSSLSKKPIPYFETKKEWEIYKELLKKFYLPRTLILEVSINPLPYASTLLKKEAHGFYQSAKLNQNLNLIQAVAEGFEEPWATSLFLGDVIGFKSAKKAYVGKRHGYIGYLINIGNFHIKDSELIIDKWLEAEWKIKGDQILEDRTLRWSFRGGGKFHENKEIKDIFYLSFRRSRTDYKTSKNFLLNNSGFEYTVDFYQKDLKPTRHYFAIDKKFPLEKLKIATSLILGFIWTSNTKYSGTLSNPDRDPFQIVIRPNIEF
ncbi:MAG: hypothetical protein HYT97_04570 [Elusimicrobia bacterium]|nr:hypothetical protein [Elusimicrobiota bacterium]